MIEVNPGRAWRVIIKGPGERPLIWEYISFHTPTNYRASHFPNRLLILLSESHIRNPDSGIMHFHQAISEGDTIVKRGHHNRYWTCFHTDNLLQMLIGISIKCYKVSTQLALPSSKRAPKKHRILKQFDIDVSPTASIVHRIFFLSLNSPKNSF